MRNLSECGIELRTREEIVAIARSAALASAAVRSAAGLLVPGARLELLRERAEEHAACRGAQDIRVFASLNATAAHGVGAGEALRHGDLLTIDVSLRLDGWYGDAAWSYVTGQAGQEALRLMDAAWRAAREGVRAARCGTRLSELAGRVRATARRLGCAIVEQCAGHGIGRALHEEPELAYANPRVDGYLVPGMVFTVEPILTTGAGLLKDAPDGSALVTGDGSLAAQFEHTVAVLPSGPVVLSVLRGREEQEFPNRP